MAEFIIKGSKKLNGTIQVLGAKNAALKMIAAAVLVKGKITLHNVPRILDIENMLEILRLSGAEVVHLNHTVTIDTTNLKNEDPSADLVEKLRASLVLIGPYLSRFGRLNVPRPGGCSIGKRPIDLHLKAFAKLGAKISHQDKFYHLRAEKLQGTVIDFPSVSVTATENVMMAAVLACGETIIKNPAKEPEIVDLANFLNQMGAKITGAGENEIKIEGVEELFPTEYTVMPDRIEAGTFVILAAVTGSELNITNCQPKDLNAFLAKISEVGVKTEIGKDYIKVLKSERKYLPISLKTDVHPGFPTDLQAPMGLLLTQASGESTIFETIWENRLGYLRQLEKMGAKIEIIDSEHAKIFGPTSLNGATINSLDLRAGATLLLAGLTAEGETIINHAENIDRGYERIEERLKSLGAAIERVQS